MGSDIRLNVRNEEIGGEGIVESNYRICLTKRRLVRFCQSSEVIARTPSFATPVDERTVRFA